MIPRYSHPVISELWSTQTTHELWLRVLLATLDVQGELGIVPDADVTAILHKPPAVDQKSISDAFVAEIRTKHDVVAFLESMRSQIDGPAARWLHYGLTSSDLVDTAMGLRFATLQPILGDLIAGLGAELTRWTIDTSTIAGRTHGQLAEPMEMRARAWHWLALTAWPGRNLMSATREMKLCKLSGPVGTFAHNPPMVEAKVASALGLRPMGPGASQIIPRSGLAAWASSAALLVECCAKIATDVRLMVTLGEAMPAFTPGQVGSSSMAHKRNPIRAEQIGGMARLARGYAQMLQPQDQWLERDIAHSSVERVALPDLWHVLLHTIESTTEMLRELTLDNWAIAQVVQTSPQLLVSARTNSMLPMSESIEEAREAALNVPSAPKSSDLTWFMRSFPVK